MCGFLSENICVVFIQMSEMILEPSREIGPRDIMLLFNTNPWWIVDAPLLSRYCKRLVDVPDVVPTGDREIFFGCIICEMFGVDWQDMLWWNDFIDSPNLELNRDNNVPCCSKNIWETCGSQGDRCINLRARCSSRLDTSTTSHGKADRAPGLFIKDLIDW